MQTAARTRLVQVGVISAIALAVVAALVFDDRGAGKERQALQDVSPSPSASAAPTPTESPFVPPPNEAGQLDGITSKYNQALSRCKPGAAVLATCGKAPAFRDISAWLNTPGGDPVPESDLTGHVVLVDFWAYSCLSCVRDQPYVSAWDDAYRRYGLRVIGVQSPEFDFEKVPANVRAAMDRLNVRYPVALDPLLHTWTSYRNRYWPAKYLIDQKGVVRAIKFGEGGYGQTENLIRQLLLEGQRPGTNLGEPSSPNLITDPLSEGATPQTYFGYSRAKRYTGTPALDQGTARFAPSQDQADDTFSLGGSWAVGTQSSRAVDNATLRISVKATKAYLVVSGTGTITVHQDGKPDRSIPVTTPDAYQVFDEDGVTRRTLDIGLSPGLKVFTMTFA